MKVSVILNTFNEGPDVGWTIAAMRQAGGDVDLEFVVVADGTSDKSCDDLGDDVKVLKPNEKVGIGKAKDIGSKHETGDVLFYNDAHNRYVQGDLAELARLCMEHEPCIVSPAVGPLGCKHIDNCKDARGGKCGITCPRYEDDLRPRNLYRGGDIILGSGGLAVDNGDKCRGDFAPSQTPNYACFAMSRKTLDRLAGWNRYPGWWGSQEVGLALRAWFSSTPIYIANTQVCLHRYRSWNHPRNRAVAPYDVPEGHRGVNQMYCHRVVFSEETWAEVWRPFFAGHASEEANRLWDTGGAEACLIQSAEFETVKARTDEDFFREVLKRPYPPKVRPVAKRALYAVGAGLGNVLMCLPAIKALAKLTAQPVDVLDCGMHLPQLTGALLEAQPFVRKVMREEPGDVSWYRYCCGSYWAESILLPARGATARDVDKAWRTRHEVECNMKAVRELGYEGPTPSAALATWHQTDIASEDAVCVGTACGGYDAKAYPHWEAVCRRLHEAGIPLIFLGAAKDDKPWMDELGTNLCGKTTLLQAAGILWASRLYVGIDNGLSHLAASVATPSILLYGPSSERKNRPWGLGVHVLRRSGYDCAPCWDKPRWDKCEDRPCMAFAPEYVAGGVMRALDAPAWYESAPEPVYLSHKQRVVNDGIRVLQCHEEFAALLSVIRSRDVYRVLEIGSCQGGWVRVLAEALGRPLRIDLVEPGILADKEGGHDKLKASVSHLSAAGHRVRLITLPSDDVSLPEGRYYDLVHIDGEHEIGQVMRDVDHFLPHLRKGGLLVLHDIENPKEPGPGAIFNAVAKRVGGRTWRFWHPKGDPKGYGIGVIENGSAQ